MISDPRPDQANEMLAVERSTRRERIVGFTLIELLITILFLIMAGLVAETTDKVIIAKQFEVSRAELKTTKAALAAAERRIKDQEAAIQRLWANWTGEPLPADPAARRALVDAIVDASLRGEKGLDTLRDQRARQGLGLNAPLCEIVPGYLLRIEVDAGPSSLGSARAVIGWDPATSPEVSTLTGLSNSTDATSLEMLMGTMARAYLWGRAQTPECRFRVEVVNLHNDLALYKSQIAAIEKYFYVKRR